MRHSIPPPRSPRAAPRRSIATLHHSPCPHHASRCGTANSQSLLLRQVDREVSWQSLTITVKRPEFEKGQGRCRRCGLPCNALRLSGKPGGWREVVLNRQQLDFGGDQISPAKRSIAARQPYTTSVLRRPARVCGFSTRPFLCPTATAACRAPASVTCSTADRAPEISGKHAPALLTADCPSRPDPSARVRRDCCLPARSRGRYETCAFHPVERRSSL